MTNRRLLLLCLALTAILVACGQADTPPTRSPSEDASAAPSGDPSAVSPSRAAPPGDSSTVSPSRVVVPEPEGPFVFCNNGVDWRDSAYGLVSDTGEILLPIRYLVVSPVYAVGRDVPDLPRPAERYYAAAAAGEVVKIESYGDVYDTIPYLYALVSTTGEVLTKHIFSRIVEIEGRTVGYLAESGEPVVIDRDTGTHRSIEDVDNEWMAGARGYFGAAALGEEAARLGKTGPDVPQGGFDALFENPDGTYYGCYSHSSGYGYRLFAADGTHLSDKVYQYLNWLGDGLYSYYIDDPYDYRSPWREGIIQDGKELTEQIYTRIYTQGDYLLLIDDINITITDKALNTLYTYKDQSGKDGWCDAYLTEQDGALYFYYSDDVSCPFVVNLGTGDRVDFTGFAGDRISSIMNGGDRFALTHIDRTADYYRSTDYLVNSEGELLLTAPNIYADGDYVVASRPIYPDRSLYDRSLYGLYDRDGQMLLPEEYRSFQLIEKGAAIVVRGDWAGIIDLAGNWIYKESVYQYLD